MPASRTRRTRRTTRRRNSTTKRPRRLTIRQGRIRYRPRKNTKATPLTFSTAVARSVMAKSVTGRRTMRGRRHRRSGSSAICKRMRVPRQHGANCWLNAAIMSLFVSQGMRGATRAVKTALVDPRKGIPGKLRPELRQLALAIHSVPLGVLTPEYSTAALIPAMRSADAAGLTTPRNRLGAPAGKAHNPIWFFTALASLLHPSKYTIGRVDLTQPSGKPYRDLESALAGAHRANGKAMPQVLIIEAGQETSGTRPRLELTQRIASGQTLTAFGGHWTLDSLIMLDTTDSHFGGVITCGGTPHTYDGMTGSRLHPKGSWREVMDRLVGRPIPTPSREEFRYDVRTGYVAFTFVPSSSRQGRQH